jgi:hypothetical protein
MKREGDLDLVDLILETLIQHEKVMDRIIERLEYVTPLIEKELMK